MAKPLSDLGSLDDSTGGAAGLSRQSLDVKHFLTHLADLIDDGTVKWAYSTLQGIYESVQQSGKVTEGQQRAVANIRKHAADAARRPASRRYEGWNPSR